MSEILNVSGAALGGFALGAFFFIGLWWTVRRGVASAQPAVIFLGSMLLRTLVVMGGFYYLSCGDWRNLVGSLIGFSLARFMVIRLPVTKNTSFLPQAPSPLGGPQ
jgi:F1F0 ATPase subunit 2